MEYRIKIIAYWLYLWAAICMVGIYWYSGITEVVVSLILAGLYYQAATGVLKNRNRDRKIAVGLLAFSVLSNLDTIINALSGAAKTNQTVLIMLFSGVVLIVSSISVYYLLTKEVATHFNKGENA
jgi:hypothetical protein